VFEPILKRIPMETRWLSDSLSPKRCLAVSIVRFISYSSYFAQALRVQIFCSKNFLCQLIAFVVRPFSKK